MVYGGLAIKAALKPWPTTSYQRFIKSERPVTLHRSTTQGSQVTQGGLSRPVSAISVGKTTYYLSLVVSIKAIFLKIEAF